MKKSKSLLSLILALCMVCCLFVAPAYADSCCTLSIDSIVQDSEKITVNFTTNSSIDERAVVIALSSLSEVESGGTRWSRITQEERTVSSGAQSSFAEFDTSLLIPGMRYGIEVTYPSYCDQYNCRNRSSEEFIAEYGMPVYEIGNTFTEFTVETTPIALKVTAPQDGIYELFVDSEYDWALDIECSDSIANTKLAGIKENESAYYQVMIAEHAWSWLTSSQAKFRADLTEISTPTALTASPTDGDIVFSMTDISGLAKLDITKAGQYEISTICTQGGNTYLLDSNYELIFSEQFNDSGTILLNAGTYYYYANTWNTPSDTYTTTLKYSAIDTLEFGTQISTDTSEKKYFYFKLDNMSAVWRENETGYLNAYIIGKDESYYFGTNATILPAGEYFLEYYAYEPSSADIMKADIPVTVIGNEINAFEDSYGQKHTILKAPETAEYEFYSSDSTEIGGEWLYSEYKYITMSAGETMYIRFFDEVKVNKYTASYTQITFNENTVFNIETGKRTGLSFTPTVDDTYILSLKDTYYNSDAYLGKIKIYTKDKVIYEGESTYFTDLEMKLDANKTVYMDISNTDGGEYSAKIIEKEKPLQISGTTTIDFSNTLYSNVVREVVFTPTEAGYYDFSVRNLSSGYPYVKVSVNGKDIGEISYSSGNSVDTMIYASPQEPLFIELTKGSNQTANGALVFTKVTTKAIEDISSFEVTDNSYYSFVLPESGVYKITGKAFYKKASWRDEGVYSYFFSPIIKNHTENTSFSYDSDGEVPVYFSGNKGDEILFKEESREYYEFEYPITASISKVDTEEIQLGSLVSSTEGCKLYSVNIPKDGVYKFEDFSDELFDSNSYYGRGFTVFCIDSEWHHSNSTTGDELNGTFELKAGTYYIAAATYDYDLEDEHIPAAKFKISKVNSDDETLQISGEKSANGITYAISGNIPENTTLYAAVYEGQNLKAIKLVTPLSEGNIPFNNISDSDTCKLFLWDSNMTPICDNDVF